MKAADKCFNMAIYLDCSGDNGFKPNNDGFKRRRIKIATPLIMPAITMSVACATRDIEPSMSSRHGRRVGQRACSFLADGIATPEASALH